MNWLKLPGHGRNLKSVSGSLRVCRPEPFAMLIINSYLILEERFWGITDNKKPRWKFRRGKV